VSEPVEPVEMLECPNCGAMGGSLPDYESCSHSGAREVRVFREEDVPEAAIGMTHAGGRIGVVYTFDCPHGHEVRSTGGHFPCPYCAVRRAEKAEAALAQLWEDVRPIWDVAHHAAWLGRKSAQVALDAFPTPEEWKA
jgi:hypothetical protein